MKKILMAGALAASMLASSAAFAAEAPTMGEVKYDAEKGVVTVDTTDIMAAHAEKQMTVVIVDGEGNDVSTETIRYIDQDAAKAGLFSSMGVLLRGEETELPVGKYTVKIGGEDITNLYIGTLEVGADGVEIVWGDVDNDGAVAVFDASAILKRNIGGDTKFGDYTIGETYTISK